MTNSRTPHDPEDTFDDHRSPDDEPDEGVEVGEESFPASDPPATY